MLRDENDMKIAVLERSPNKKGSSNLLAAEFIRGAKESGHSVQVVDAAHGDIHPCTGCISSGIPTSRTSSMRGWTPRRFSILQQFFLNLHQYRPMTNRDKCAIIRAALRFVKRPV